MLYECVRWYKSTRSQCKRYLVKTFSGRQLFLSHFDVLLYRTPSELIFSDETLDIPFNSNFCLCRMEKFQLPPCPTRSMGAGECRHPRGMLVLKKKLRSVSICL